MVLCFTTIFSKSTSSRSWGENDNLRECILSRSSWINPESALYRNQAYSWSTCTKLRGKDFRGFGL